MNLHPGDNKPLTATHDYLFLVRLLRHQHLRPKYYTTIADAKSPLPLYFAEDHHGRFYNPETADIVDFEDTWSVKQRVHTRTLLNHFFGTFYGLRSLLQTGGSFDQTVAVGWLKLFHDGKPERVRHFLFNRWLKYPLAGNHDPLLFDKRAYFEKANGILNDAGGAELDDPHFCPLDGIVKPIHVHVQSPDWTWRALCGRRWTYTACPQCLFTFMTELTQMN